MGVQNKRSEAHYATLSGDMRDDDPGWDMQDPMADLEEEIVRLRAVTAEGHLARARCAAFTYLPCHRVYQDDLKRPGKTASRRHACGTWCKWSGGSEA